MSDIVLQLNSKALQIPFNTINYLKIFRIKCSKSQSTMYYFMNLACIRRSWSGVTLTGMVSPLPVAIGIDTTPIHRLSICFSCKTCKTDKYVIIYTRPFTYKRFSFRYPTYNMTGECTVHHF